MNDKQIVSLQIFNTHFEVVYRESSNRMLLCNPPRPASDRVWKEVWHIEDDRLQLKETIQGTHIPSYYQPDQITFP